jgi:hypothetical protein
MATVDFSLSQARLPIESKDSAQVDTAVDGSRIKWVWLRSQYYSIWRTIGDIFAILAYPCVQWLTLESSMLVLIMALGDRLLQRGTIYGACTQDVRGG